MRSASLSREFSTGFDPEKSCRIEVDTLTTPIACKPAMPFTSTTSEAAKQLRLSEVTLRRLRDEGALKAGLHYRAMGQGTKRPPLLWDPAATDAALAQRSRRVLSK